MRATSPWTIPIAALTLALLLYSHEVSSPQTGPLGVSPGFCGFPGAATPLSSQITAGAAYASMSVTNGAITTPTIPTLSQGSIIGALFIVTANTVRERHDGTNPTQDAGMLYGTAVIINGLEFPVDKMFVACGSDLAKVRLTGATSAASTVHVIFYGAGR